MKRNCRWCGFIYDTKKSSSKHCIHNPNRDKNFKYFPLKPNIVKINVIVR